MEISMPRRLISSDCSSISTDATLAQAAHDRALDGEPARLADEVDHLAHRPARGLGRLPSGELFCDRVQVLDAALGIGRDDRVADGLSVTWAFSFSSNSWISACLRTEISAIVPS